MTREYSEDEKTMALNLVNTLGQIFRNEINTTPPSVFLNGMQLFLEHREELRAANFLWQWMEPNGFDPEYVKKLDLETKANNLKSSKILPSWFTKDLEDALLKLRDFKGKPKKAKPSIDKPTFIYLMVDEVNGYHKIGQSKKPSDRERTLQSEKPSVRLVEKWFGTWNDEFLLHARFASKRIRGEWFNLSGNDIVEIWDFFSARRPS